MLTDGEGQSSSSAFAASSANGTIVWRAISRLTAYQSTNARWAELRVPGEKGDLERRSYESGATWEQVTATGRNGMARFSRRHPQVPQKATTQTPVGAVVLEFEFDARLNGSPTTEWPIIALSSLIWGGIESMIDRCRSA